ncbi:glycosyltransferase family 2 protein [Acidicapsa ligni]|uniref:glycosyltransferase family 2 protein n=1 Tax=Acidicapsa ligni TaxID=542300 RepID=UPI0021E0F01D|nr:glycosyltransferase family 2 protein [Acidicapsa ligni]
MNKISIITPSLNQCAYLGETLESIRIQNYANVEHLVLDGVSTDGSVALLLAKTGPEWQHMSWVSERDGGCTQALNKGIRLATGDIIGWLNSDDRYRPGCLELVAKIFEQNPDIDVIYGDFTFMNEHGTHLRVRREIEFSRLVLFYHRISPIPSTATFFRRRIFDEGNFFDESLQFAMDYEFFVRLVNKGYRFKHIHALLADFRLHPTSKTCATGARQLAETRMTMHKYSPVATRVKNKTLRDICLYAMQIAAPFARYTEKLLRGYYLPDSIIGRERPIR